MSGVDTTNSVGWRCSPCVRCRGESYVARCRRERYRHHEQCRRCKWRCLHLSPTLEHASLGPGHAIHVIFLRSSSYHRTIFTTRTTHDPVTSTHDKFIPIHVAPSLSSLPSATPRNPQSYLRRQGAPQSSNPAARTRFLHSQFLGRQWPKSHVMT